MTDALRTPICDLFGIRYPIVQTGMGWVSDANLTAATSSAGGLGILAAATLSSEELAESISDIQARTDAPFGVNIRADNPDVGTRVDMIIDRGVKVASFATAPRADLVSRLKEANVITLPTIGALRHAEKVAEWGVDAVIAQGAEGGGHTGSVPTSILLPQVTAAVRIPVLGAGGFVDGRGLVAALALGAAGIAMGTRFLLTQESPVPDEVKARYLEARVTDTVVTHAIDGHPQRVIRTRLVDALERTGLLRFPLAAWNALRFRGVTGTSFGDLFREGLSMRRNQGLSWSQVAMAANAPMLTRATMVDGRLDVGILPTGQVTGRIDRLPTVAELIEAIMGEARQVLARLDQGQRHE